MAVHTALVAVPAQAFSTVARELRPYVKEEKYMGIEECVAQYLL